MGLRDVLIKQLLPDSAIDVLKGAGKGAAKGTLGAFGFRMVKRKGKKTATPRRTARRTTPRTQSRRW